jgi:uncharacterized protein (TIRG00374 family)
MTRQTIAKISAVVITIALVAILLSQIQITDVITTLAGIDPLYLIAGFVLYVCSYFFRALRFHILLNREVGLRDLLNIVCVHNMANNILPARTGELSYIYLLKKLHNKTTGEGIATLLVARVFDFIAISLLFFISALMIRDLPEIIMKAVWAIALFMFLIVIFLVILLYSGESLLNLVRRFFRRFNLEKRYFIDYLLRKGEETVESFEEVKTRRVVFWAFLFSVLVWCFMFSTTYVILSGLNFYLPLYKVIAGSTFAMVITILPIQSLSGFGTYEGAWAIAFMALRFSKEHAIISGFSVHIISIIYFLIIGGYGFHSLNWLKRVNHKNPPKEEIVTFLNSLKEERKYFRASDNEILKAKITYIEKINDKSVGIVGVKKIFGIPVLFIVILLNFHGKGIGNKLMKKINNLAKERYSFIMLKVLKENKVAIDLYKKYGYQFCGYTKDSYFMILPLKIRGYLFLYILRISLSWIYKIYSKIVSFKKRIL